MNHSATLQRVIGFVTTLWIIASISFILTRLVPGGPFDTEQGLPAEIIEQLQQNYHLNDPLITQYTLFLKQLLHADLGTSLSQPQYQVLELIRYGLPVSAKIGLLALIMAIGLCLLWSTLLLIYANTRLAKLINMIVFMAGSIPNFILGPVLIYLCCIKYHWLPINAWDQGGIRGVLLPATTLALNPAAIMTWLVQAKVNQIANSRFILTAKAKGSGLTQVVYKHILPHTSLPISSYLVPTAANIMTGSAVIERLFLVPGIGRYFIDAALVRDYPVVIGMTLLYALFLLALSLIADLYKSWLDPRIQ